jgi:hypothetical protein
MAHPQRLLVTKHWQGVTHRVRCEIETITTIIVIANSSGVSRELKLVQLGCKLTGVGLTQVW